MENINDSGLDGLKGYRPRKGNRQRLIESVFALWKYSWIEDGQLLAKKGTDHYLFLLSFLSEPEAERFEENFSQDRASPISVGVLS